MSVSVADLACRLVPRVSADGHPFTEILHTWREGGRERCALSRLNFAQADTPHARAYHNQQFLTRRKRAAVKREMQTEGENDGL